MKGGVRLTFVEGCNALVKRRLPVKEVLWELTFVKSSKDQCVRVVVFHSCCGRSCVQPRVLLEWRCCC